MIAIPCLGDSGTIGGDSDNIGSITLKKGQQTLTLHIIENGNMNLDYLTFTAY